jgi:hypothetical protein
MYRVLGLLGEACVLYALNIHLNIERLEGFCGNLNESVISSGKE